MSDFIQRVYVVIESGNDPDYLIQMTPLNIVGVIPTRKHPRDERAIAAVLRDMADRIEEGCSFQGCELKGNLTSG